MRASTIKKRRGNAMGKALALAAAVGLLFATSAGARITEIRIESVEPFVGNHGFGEAGPYVRIKGVARGELDPAAHTIIVDLDKAPRNARGMVEYEVDIFILRPADPAKGNGILFYEVLNRGNKQLAQRLHDLVGGSAAILNDPKTPEHTGNGFLFERGYTVVWSEWDPDVPKRNSTMGARFPAIMDEG